MVLRGPKAGLEMAANLSAITIALKWANLRFLCAGAPSLIRIILDFKPRVFAWIETRFSR